MNSQARLIEMRGRGIDRNIDQLLDLRMKRALLTCKRVLEVGFEEVVVNRKHTIPRNRSNSRAA